jgi:alpha-glucosidase
LWTAIWVDTKFDEIPVFIKGSIIQAILFNNMCGELEFDELHLDCTIRKEMEIGV